MNILYPGSFNPITKAHIMIARTASEYLNDKVVFIPATDTYKKESLLTPFTVRYDLIRKTIAGDERLAVSDIEYQLSKKLQRQPKTVETIEYFPGTYLLVGADNFIHMDKWYRADTLFNKIKVVVYPRKGYEVKDHKYIDKVIVLDSDKIDISSSAIRSDPTKAGDLLDPKTYELIEQRYKKYFQ